MFWRLSLIFALLWAFTSPALAMTPAQRVLLLSGQQKPALSLNFVRGLYSENSSTYSSLSSLPGWSFSGGTSPNGVVEDSGAGTYAVYSSGSPRIVPNRGLSVWQAATNLFLNNATCATQSVSTSAGSYTVSMYGTGSITLSGSATGTLTGAGASTRSSLSVTATSGTLTLTVSGSATYCQVETGSFATPAIITSGVSATRTADVAVVTGLSPAAGVTLWAKVNAVRSVAGPNNEYAATLNDGTSNNRISFFRGLSASAFTARYTVGGTAYLASGTAAGIWGIGAHAMAESGPGIVNSAIDGGNVLTGSAAPSVPPFTKLGIGLSETSASGWLNDYVQAVAVYSTTSSSSKLQSITH